MRRKHDVNTSFYGLCQLILLFALVHGGKPNAQHNWIFFIPIFILFMYTVFLCASDSPTFDYAFIQAFIYVVPMASDYILLRNHQRELRKIGQKKTTSEMTFTERLVWAASLLATWRGIGWTHEPTAHLPPRPTASRGKFIVSQFLWIIFYVVIWDIASIHSQENPCFKAGGPSFTAFGWWWRTTSCVFIVSVYCTMNALYAAGSIVYVATGLYEPKDCPHLFGSILDAYTVRKCWGYVLTIFYLFLRPPPLRNRTVAFGTRCFAGCLQATQIFLHASSISQQARSRPTSNFSRHSSSPDSCTLPRTIFSTRISSKAHLFNFSFSKRLPSRLKTRLLLLPRSLDTRDREPSN